jgi:hypothetical protein
MCSYCLCVLLLCAVLLSLASVPARPQEAEVAQHRAIIAAEALRGLHDDLQVG